MREQASTPGLHAPSPGSEAGLESEPREHGGGVSPWEEARVASQRWNMSCAWKDADSFEIKGRPVGSWVTPHPLHHFQLLSC